MFSPLYLGTNHMLGVDNYVPLTTNPLVKLVPSHSDMWWHSVWIAGTKRYTTHRKALPTTVDNDETCINYEGYESRKKSKSSIMRMVRMSYAAIQIYRLEIAIDAKACKNRESAAFASNRGGFNDYSPIKIRIGSARLCYAYSTVRSIQFKQMWYSLGNNESYWTMLNIGSKV